MKICNECKLEKNDDDFYERKKGSGRFFIFCKDCFRERQKRYYNNNLEKEKERLKKYYREKKAKKTEQ